MHLTVRKLQGRREVTNISEFHISTELYIYIYIYIYIDIWDYLLESFETKIF